MKYSAFIILFLTFSHHVVAQLSISVGYDRRSEDTLISFKKHFTAPAKNSFYRYNIGYLKVGYRTKKKLMITSEIGFSPTKKKQFYNYSSYSSGGGSSPTYSSYYRYKSTISYSTLTLNFGVNRLFEWKGFLLKKLSHSFFIGAFIQNDLFINFRNDDKTIRTIEWNNSNMNHVFVQTKDITESTNTTPFEVKKVRLNVGIGITKRTEFRSFFIEYKVEFSVGNYKRLVQEVIYSYNFENNNNEIYFGDDSRIYYPIIETGIGVGYQFNKRKTKPVAPISIN